MNEEFNIWWKSVGQYDCALESDSWQELKRVLQVAWDAGHTNKLAQIKNQLSSLTLRWKSISESQRDDRYGDSHSIDLFLEELEEALK